MKLEKAIYYAIKRAIHRDPFDNPLSGAQLVDAGRRGQLLYLTLPDGQLYTVKIIRSVTYADVLARKERHA